MGSAEEFITNMLNDSNIIYLINMDNSVNWVWYSNGTCLMNLNYRENYKTLTISFNRIWNYISYKNPELNDNEINNLFRKIIMLKYDLDDIKIIKGLPH